MLTATGAWARPASDSAAERHAVFAGWCWSIPAWRSEDECPMRFDREMGMDRTASEPCGGSA
jgi:hypothetical protein